MAVEIAVCSDDCKVIHSWMHRVIFAYNYYYIISLLLEKKRQAPLAKSIATLMEESLLFSLSFNKV